MARGRTGQRGSGLCAGRLLRVFGLSKLARSRSKFAFCCIRARWIDLCRAFASAFDSRLSVTDDGSHGHGRHQLRLYATGSYLEKPGLCDKG